MQETEFRDMNQRRHHAMSLCAISLLTVFAFLPTCWNGFHMEWDDQRMVMNPLTTTKIYNNLNK